MAEQPEQPVKPEQSAPDITGNANKGAGDNQGQTDGQGIVDAAKGKVEEFTGRSSVSCGKRERQSTQPEGPTPPSHGQDTGQLPKRRIAGLCHSGTSAAGTSATGTSARHRRSRHRHKRSSTSAAGTSAAGTSAAGTSSGHRRAGTGDRHSERAQGQRSRVVGYRGGNGYSSSSNKSADIQGL